MAKWSGLQTCYIVPSDLSINLLEHILYFFLNVWMHHIYLSCTFKVNCMKVLKVNDNYRDFTHFIGLIHSGN